MRECCLGKLEEDRTRLEQTNLEARPPSGWQSLSKAQT